MGLGTNFPTSQYVQGNILDGRTLSRDGTWWSAVLLIEQPTSGKRVLALYRWQLVSGQWKTRAKFNIGDRSNFDEVVAACGELLAGRHYPKDPASHD